MSLRILSFAAVFSHGAGTFAEGAVFTWDNGNGNSNWSSPANWSPDGEPGAADDVIFPSNKSGAIFLSAGENAKSLQFNQNYQLVSGGLTLATGAAITVAAGRVAEISSTLTAPGTPAKNGPGTLVLSGANTMSGSIAVNEGILLLANASAAGSSASAVAVASGAALQLSSITFQQPVNLADGAELAAQGSGSAYGRVSIAAGANTVTLSGRSASSVLQIGNAANELTGGNAATVAHVNGPGTVRLNSPSNYAGSWQVNSGGKLEAGNLGALGANSAGSVTLNGGTFSNKLLDGGIFTGPSSIVLTADSTIMVDEDEEMVFPKVSMGGHGLHFTLGPGSSPLWSIIQILELQLTGNPLLHFTNEAGCSLSALKGGAVPRTITLTGSPRLYITGGAVELAPGSRFVATGGGLVAGIFPPLPSGGQVVPAPGQNPLGPADFQGSGTLALYASGADSNPQTIEMGNNIEASGRLTLQVDPGAFSIDSGKTFRLGNLTVAAGGGLTLSSGHYYRAAFAGPVLLRGDAAFGVGGGSPGRLTLGVMSETVPGTLTFEGPAGEVNLTGVSSRTGPVVVTGGDVNATVSGALGSGSLTISGGRLNVSAAGGITTASPVAVSNNGMLNLANPSAASGKTVSLTDAMLMLSSEPSATFNLAALNVSGNCRFQTTSGLASTFGQIISLDAPVTVAANSRLQFESASAYVVTQRWLQPVQLNGDAKITADELSAMAVAFAGGISETTPSKLTFSLDGSYSFSTSLEGPGNWSGGTLVGRGAVLTVKAPGGLGTGAVQINGAGVSNGPTTLAVAPGGSLAGVAGVEVIEGVLEYQHTGAGANVPVTMRGGSLVLKADTAGTFTHGGMIFDGARITITPARFSGGVTAQGVLTALGSLTVRNNPLLVFPPGMPSNRLTLGPVLLESDLTLETGGPPIFTGQDPAGTLPAFRESGGPRKIIKSGFLPLFLSALSTHSGGLDITAGMLVIQHPQGAGTGPILLDGPTASAQLRVAGGITVNNTVTAKSGTIGAVTAPGTSGVNTLAGPVSLTGAVTLNNSLASEFVVSGPVSGAFGITVTGTGATRLTNTANSFGPGLAGSINVNGGVMEAASDAALGNPANGLTLSGATAKFRPLTSFSTSRSLTLPAPSGILDIPADVQLTLQGPVSGPGTLTKSGGGTLALASAAAAGACNVTGGALALSGGQLTVTGNFSLAAGVTTRITIPASASPSWSSLTVGGSATISGALTLDVAPGASLAVGSRITLLDKTSPGTVNGTFTGLAEGASLTTASGHTFAITYTGGDGNDIATIVLSAPAPGDSPPSITSFTLGNGTGAEAGLTVIDMAASGVPGVSYSMEQSANLQSWQVVQTVTSNPGNGGLLFHNAHAPVSHLYFRIKKAVP